MLSRTNDQIKGLRHEHKFVVEAFKQPHVESLLKIHPAMFYEVYPMRAVNNIYLDSMGKNCYWENKAGVGNRQKFRIRWYGDFSGHITSMAVEKKVKQNHLGSKKRYNILPCTFHRGFSSRCLKNILCKSNLPDSLLEELNLMEPILINRYMRKYFLSADRNFRITLDWQMSFYRFHALNNAFMGRISLMDQMVIELKYAADQNLDPSEVTRFFPFRHTRNSKYIVGMDLTA